MNKIYQAFDSIKLDKEVKKRAYQRLEEKPKKRTYMKLIYSLSFALAVFIFIIAVSTNTPPRTNDDNISILNVPAGLNDVIMYDSDRYMIDYDIDIDTIDINKKIGVLNQIDSNKDLKNNFESYYHDGYDVYSSNEDDVLVIKFNDDVLAYIKE